MFRRRHRKLSIRRHSMMQGNYSLYYNAAPADISPSSATLIHSCGILNEPRYSKLQSSLHTYTIEIFMITSSNGNIFRVTGHLCGEFTGPPVTRSFDVFFDLCLNKRLSKQSWDWWFETLSGPLWRHRNVSADNLYFMVASFIYSQVRVISTLLKSYATFFSIIYSTYCLDRVTILTCWHPTKYFAT